MTYDIHQWEGLSLQKSLPELQKLFPDDAAMNGELLELCDRRIAEVRDRINILEQHRRHRIRSIILALAAFAIQWGVFALALSYL